MVTIEVDMIDNLVKGGRVTGGSRIEAARIGMALLGHADAAKVDVSTVEAFTRALYAAKSIGYVGDGHSGVVFLRTLDQLGLTAKLKPKFILLTGRGCMVAIPIVKLKSAQHQQPQSPRACKC